VPTAGPRGSCNHLGVEDEAAERESAYELLQRGQGLLKQRHFAQAAIVLERAARAEPGKGSILEALGRAYYNSGQHERSRETFEALLEVDPSAHYAHFALGQSLKLLGRPKQARTHLRLAVALSPTSKLYSGALARLGPPEPDPEDAGDVAGSADAAPTGEAGAAGDAPPAADAGPDADRGSPRDNPGAQPAD
jgi:tetratricopeptide (TPR) repeat protein